MTDRGGGELPGRVERRGNTQMTDGDEPANHEKDEEHDPQVSNSSASSLLSPLMLLH